MKKIALLIILATILCSAAMSQENMNMEVIVKATEFSIPKSGAFTLLGNNPANVTSPGFTKDIKLDYFLDKFSLQPNIAFEFQPVWLFGFKNVSLDEYARKNTLSRVLSTASVSIGTASVDDVKKIAYSLKLTVGKDPLLDQTYKDTIQKILDKAVARRMPDAAITQRAQLLRNESRRAGSLSAVFDARILILQSELISATRANLRDQIKDSLTVYAEQKARLQSQINENRDELESLQKLLEDRDKDPVYTEQLKHELKSAMNAYIESNWYKPKVDFGLGLVNTYQDESLTQLGLKNNGLGIWINPSIGFMPDAKSARKVSKGSASRDIRVKPRSKLLLTGLFRYVDSDIGSQSFIGGNLRYGTAKINLFSEYTYLKQGSTRINSIAYGGTYMIGTKKAIEFGIRTDYDHDFDFKSIIPVIAFDWKLAAEVLR